MLLPEQERGFLLHPGQRDPQVAPFVDAEWVAREVAKQFGNVGIADAPRVQPVGRRRGLPFGKELQGTNAITADGAEEAVEIAASCPRALGDAAAHVLIIGQKIVEERDDGGAGITPLAQRQGQRHRNGVGPAEPLVCIPEVDGATRFAAQLSDALSVQEDIKRSRGAGAGAGAGHQNSSSSSSTRLVVRGRTTSSRSSAASAFIKVWSCVAGSPFSSLETVA